MAVEVRLPLPGEQVFRYAAMDEALEILARNPTEEFSNRELQRLTWYGGPSVSKALSLLEAMELIVRRDTGSSSTRTRFRRAEPSRASFGLSRKRRLTAIGTSSRSFARLSISSES